MGNIMKKKLLLIMLILVMLFAFVQTASATSVFLTSDHIGSESNDLNMLNSVKNYIEEISNGQLEVIVDSKAPSPGEGTRAIESDADVSVNFAANCAGNFLLLSKAKQNIDKQIIFVNVGNLDLDNADFIRRAWDDDYSSDYFAGIKNPGTFLKESGIDYIQPLKQYPDAGEIYKSNDDEINRYIAQEIVNKVYNKNTNNYYDENLIVTHSMHPSIMAQASKELVDSDDYTYQGTYNSYTAPQILYMTSSYLNGNGLTEPKDFNQPENPWEYSVLTSDSYSIYEYMEMASIVKSFMDENGRAPNYIQYGGSYLAYPDLVYNFARISENHTDASHMDFASNYRFDKVQSSLLLDLLPALIALLVILILCKFINSIKNRKFGKKRR